MHEQSLVKNLLSQTRCIAVEHGATAVEEIEVEIGPLSGVEPLLIESAFEILRTDDVVKDARLTIRQVPLRIECHDCAAESQLSDFRFRCSACQSGRVHVIQGDTFRLLSVTLVEPSDPGSISATGITPNTEHQ